MKMPPTSLEAHFDGLKDPRRDHCKKYDLKIVIILAIMAVIAGADDWVGIERYGVLKLAWLKGILDLPHGIPSHDTFRRVFALLDPEAFQACFMNWVQSWVQLKVGEVVALDGKTIRRSQDRWKGKEAIQMVSAWASQAGIVLAQRPVPEGSNEIATVPDVLRSLVLRGCIVTMDAANCQTQNARIIVEQGGDYVFALKENQPTLHAEVAKVYETRATEDFKTIKHDTFTTHNKSHGRIETRRHVLIHDPDYLEYFNRQGRWWQLAGIGWVERTRQLKDKTEHQVHFFVTSLKPNVAQFADAVRRHWSIENNLHWTLDIAFDEDHSRARTAFEAENLSVLRHFALNLLKLETSVKDSIKGKRQRAGWNDDFMLAVLHACPSLN